MPNPYLLLGVGIMAILAIFGAYRHGVSITTDHYEAAIQRAAVQAERVTREAAEKAREVEREQIARLAQQFEEAAAKARSGEKLAQRQRDEAIRKLSQVPKDDSCADSRDAYAPFADGMRDNHDPHGAGGGGASGAGAGAAGVDGTLPWR